MCLLVLWLGAAAMVQVQDTAKQDRERHYQQAYWENHRKGQPALESGDLTTAEAKFLLTRKAAEEGGDEKWRDLAGVLSYLGTIKKDQNDSGAAEQLYRQSLDIRLKHEGMDSVGVAGAQEDLATLYYLNRQFKKAEPLLLQSIKTYEAQLRGPSSQEDRTGYGRNLAMEYMALSQIALADSRMQEFRDRCKQAVANVERWGKPSDKDLPASRCEGSPDK